VLAPERIVSARLVRIGCCANAADVSITDNNNKVATAYELENECRILRKLPGK
jgi:hypothetical protein